MIICKKLNVNHIDLVMDLMINNQHNFIKIDTRQDAINTIKESFSFGLFDKNLLIGFLLVFKPNILNVFEYDKKDVLITDILIIDKKYRGRNYSYILKQKIKEIAILNNIKYLISTVSPLNLKMLKTNLNENYKIKYLMQRKENNKILEHNYNCEKYDIIDNPEKISVIENTRYLMVCEL